MRGNNERGKKREREREGEREGERERGRERGERGIERGERERKLLLLVVRKRCPDDIPTQGEVTLSSP